MTGPTPDELRRQADILESQQCTGAAARWCPIHGDCTCPRDEDNDLPISGGLDDPRCPVHAPGCAHAAAELATWGQM